MPESQTSTWKLALGYTAFALVTFYAALAWTFPSDAVAERVSSEASARGWNVRIGKIGMGLFGLSAKNVDLSSKSAEPLPEGAPEPAPLHIDAIALRPSLFPLGLHVRAEAFGGTVNLAAGGLDAVAIKGELSGIDLASADLKAFSGLDMGGSLNGNVDLTIPKPPPPANSVPANSKLSPPAAEPDLGQASGTIALNGNNVVLNGGAIESIPALSGGFPKIELGALDAKLEFDKGAGKVDALEIKGADITATGGGTIRLAKRWDFSDTNIDLCFKIEEEARKRLGAVAFGLNMLQTCKSDPTMKAVKMTGYLGRPNFR